MKETPPRSAPSPGNGQQRWPLSWVLIAVLVYIALQTAYFLFFVD